MLWRREKPVRLPGIEGRSPSRPALSLATVVKSSKNLTKTETCAKPQSVPPAVTREPFNCNRGCAYVNGFPVLAERLTLHVEVRFWKMEGIRMCGV